MFDEQNINNLGESTTQHKDLADSIMAKIHNKYDLRPKENTSTTNPPKTILSWNKVNEAVISKSPTKVQAAQIKQVETKETQTKKLKFRPKN